MATSFFEESKEQSIVKARIVDKYFFAWFNVIKRHAKRVAYIDLFAGPGRYEDGTESTPLKILKGAIDNPELCEKLVTIFNDKDHDSVGRLQGEIEKLPGVEKLKFKPDVRQGEVGEEIVAHFEEMTVVPTFFFVDPWGYKGLSLRLVESVLKDWGCDCVFFFNYNRISMGISNPAVKCHMDALFGEDRATELSQKVAGVAPEVREAMIIEAMVDAFQEHGKRYVLPFRFRDDRGTRTSHHLIFLSKSVVGYTIMKKIMAKESSEVTQGVANFEFNPAILSQGLLFELARPLDDLADMILKKFKGRTLSVKQVFDNHHVGLRFIDTNYKDVLRQLEDKRVVSMDYPDSPGKKRPIRNGVRTVSDKLLVTFPK